MPENNIVAPNAPPTAGPATAGPLKAEVVNPTKTNYAAAVFFTLLIVGFTFHLPNLLYVPLIFFCIAAGIFFFKDVLKSNRASSPGWQPVTMATTASAQPQKKNNMVARILLIIFGVIGLCIVAYASFIILIVILFAKSGV